VAILVSQLVDPLRFHHADLAGLICHPLCQGPVRPSRNARETGLDYRVAGSGHLSGDLFCRPIPLDVRKTDREVWQLP
jgi:hypothetical protein